MESIQLSKLEYDQFKKKVPNFSGREGNLYRVQNRLYKLYHHPKYYSKVRLEEICALQPWIEHTKLPFGSITCQDQFLGVSLMEHRGARSFSSLENTDLSFRIKKLKELSRNLTEFSNLGIVLQDLDLENVLLSKEGTVELIDLDGDNLVTSEDPTIMLTLYQTMIMDLCLPNYRWYDHTDLLAQKISFYLRETPSYFLLQEFLECIEKDYKRR